MPRGAASFIAMPLVGAMLSKFEPRKMLFAGLVCVGFAMFRFGHFNTEVGYWDFFWPMIIQGAAMGLVFVPLTTITNGPIPKEQMGNATSIFNLMRNIGASIGIASVTTVLSRHQQVHANGLGQFITQFNSQAQALIESMKSALIARGSDPVTATRQAYAAVYGMVQKQAAMMSYNDTFIMMAYIAAGMLPLIFLMQRPKKTKGPVAMH